MNTSKIKVASIVFLALMIISGLAMPLAYAQDTPSQETKYKTATIYYNEACTMCSMYIIEELVPTLEQAGIKNIIKKDYVNEKQNRVELNTQNKKYGIPPALQAHFMIFIDDNIVLGGHVPEHIISDLLTENPEFDKILVYQDEMDNAKTYKAWGFKGEAQEYDINTPISKYVDWYNENKETLKEPESSSGSWGMAAMLPLILSTGFLDGINPCALGVLLFFITFLYTIRKTKTGIWKMGVVYISAIFLAYFLIGIGLMKAFVISGFPHLMAKLAAYLIIFLGLINISNFIFPKMKFRVGIPVFSVKYIKRWMYKATIPAAFILGFLVGLCTFPCSGGIYVAVVGLLAAKSTYVQGIAYLIIYNIMFVMPLVIILLTASNKRVTKKITEWEKSESKVLKLISGLVMIALALAILTWFV